MASTGEGGVIHRSVPAYSRGELDETGALITMHPAGSPARNGGGGYPYHTRDTPHASDVDASLPSPSVESTDLLPDPAISFANAAQQRVSQAPVRPPLPSAVFNQHHHDAELNDSARRFSFATPPGGRPTRPATQRAAPPASKQPIPKPLQAGGRRVKKKSSGKTVAGRVKRGNGFEEFELNVFLEVLEHHLPIGGDEWDLVCKEHCEEMEEPGCRTTDSLRRKFASLYRKKTPTGDPTCPSSVRRAKRIRQKIVDRSEMSDCDDGEAAVRDAFDSSIATDADSEAESDDDDVEKDSDQLAASGWRMDTEKEARPLAKKGAEKTIVRPRRGGRKIADPGSSSNSSSEIMAILKMQMLEDAKRRAADSERREQEREDAREERAEEARRRAEDREDQHREREAAAKRSEDFMKIMMMSMCKKND